MDNYYNIQSIIIIIGIFDFIFIIIITSQLIIVFFFFLIEFFKKQQYQKSLHCSVKSSLNWYSLSLFLDFISVFTIQPSYLFFVIVIFLECIRDSRRFNEIMKQLVYYLLLIIWLLCSSSIQSEVLRNESGLGLEVADSFTKTDLDLFLVSLVDGSLHACKRYLGLFFLFLFSSIHFYS